MKHRIIVATAAFLSVATFASANEVTWSNETRSALFDDEHRLRSTAELESGWENLSEEERQDVLDFCADIDETIPSEDMTKVDGLEHVSHQEWLELCQLVQSN